MYVEVQEVRDSIKNEAIDSIIGGEDIEDEQEKESKIKVLIEEAIDDADAEINGYLGKRYSIPLRCVPKVIKKFSKDIALYNLFSRHGIEKDSREETYLTRYNAAIAFLSNVAKGILDIETENAEDETSGRSSLDFRVKSNPRIFSRKSLRGM